MSCAQVQRSWLAYLVLVAGGAVALGDLDLACLEEEVVLLVDGGEPPSLPLVSLLDTLGLRDLAVSLALENPQGFNV